MVFLDKTSFFFRNAFLLGLGLTVNMCSLQAMEKSAEDDEEVLTSQLLKLHLAERKAYTLFAQRYLGLIEDIKNFRTLDEGQKKEFLKRLLNEARAFMRGQYCIDDNDNLLETIRKLGQNCLEDLVGRYDDNDDKQKLSKILNSSKNKLDRSLNSLIISACHLEYKNLEIIEEKHYMEVLQKIISNFPLDVFFINRLFIECLDRCDDIFKQREKTWKYSLSTFDLEEELRRICGCELITLKSVHTRVQDTRDISVVSSKQVNMSDIDDEGLARLCFLIALWVIPFMIYHYFVFGEF